MAISNDRTKIARQKQTIARRMFKDGKNNGEVKEAIMKKFMTGIGQDTLAKIRADLGIYGFNKDASQKKKRRKNKLNPADILLLQQDNMSSDLKSCMISVRGLMIAENIESITINKHGDIHAIRLKNVEYKL